MFLQTAQRPSRLAMLQPFRQHTQGERLTHYAYAAKRGKEAMDAIGILPAYAGTVVSDALCAYRQYGQSRHALCGAHLLQDRSGICG